MRVLSVFARPLLGLDVGTSAIRVCSESSLVVEMPAGVREELEGGNVYRRALRGGVVCDIATAAEAIAPAIRQVSRRWRRPAAVICAPSDATENERERLVEAVCEAGATVSAIVPEPLAAAIGSGVDISSEYAHMIVDIGDGVTDVAIIANGTIVRSEARRIGCSDIRLALVEWLQWHRGMAIDDAAADAIVRAFCTKPERQTFPVRGLEIDSRKSAPRIIDRDDVAMLIEPVLDSISGFVGSVFTQLPDRMAVEVIESGMKLTGGGSRLRLLVEEIEAATGLQALCAPEPLRSVVNGVRTMLSGKS